MTEEHENILRAEARERLRLESRIRELEEALRVIAKAPNGDRSPDESNPDGWEDSYNVGWDDGRESAAVIARTALHPADSQDAGTGGAR